jgi:L-threonylcarbamoyladenylate synthase
MRPGAVTLSQLQRVVGEVLVDTSPHAPRVPGSQRSHYAPATPVSIIAGDDLERIVAGMGENGQRAGVLAMRPPLGTYPMLTWINAGPRAEAYAHVLYAHLRTLDKVGCARILVQEVPSDERWDAARDRLQRAAAATTEEITDTSDAMALGVLP